MHDRLATRNRTMGEAFALIMVMPLDVFAYVDPGTTGMLSQVLYVLFYGALGIFLYMLRYIKQYMDNFKQFLERLLGRRL